MVYLRKLYFFMGPQKHILFSLADSCLEQTFQLFLGVADPL